MPYKKDFPIFKNRKLPFVYLDSAATSQKPQVVIDAVSSFYTKHNANVHRGIYELSEEATELYENARAKVARFIGASTDAEIIFTGNANEAINLAAYGWGRQFLKKGDVIVLSIMEHHANILAWQRLRNEIGVKLHFLPITKEFRLDYRSLIHSKDKEHVRLVSLTHASNVLGTINPIKEIIAYYKKQGIKAKFLIDGAQSVPHIPIDVVDLDCDFYVLSGHKMLGPSGIGVLWCKTTILETMEPLFVGSQMILHVTKDQATFNDIPWKFEVGTGKLEAAVGLGAAVDYLAAAGMDNIMRHEQKLTQYGLAKLQKVKGVKLYGPADSHNRLAVFSFDFGAIHPHDVAEILNRSGVCVRSGHHCAQPLMETLGITATTRASCYLYNDEKDIDALVDGLQEVKSTMKV